MGLLIDVPKTGFGTTNDGNSASQFFDNPELVSNITDVNDELICRFGIILKSIASAYSINIKEFEEYCSETADLYVQKYKWYFMPQSVHKILIYGAKIYNEALFSVEIMSEEAQKARNKDFKQFIEYHTRKFSRL